MKNILTSFKDWKNSGKRFGFVTLKMKASWLRSVILYGDWYCGIESRKTWPRKSYWSMGSLYYDGYHYYLHIGWFYIAIDH